MHDTNKKQILPYAEFATNCHNVESISRYLTNIFNNTGCIAPFVVTDESWALINSVNKAFNSCSTLQYLNWAYIVLTKKEMDFNMHSAMNTRIILCQTHFFKNIAMKAKEIVKDDKKVYQFFLYTFTVLQNSTSICEFEENLKYLYDIFCRRLLNQQTSVSISRINVIVAERNLDIFRLHESKELNQFDTNQFNDKRHIFWKSNDSESINQSDFSNHFDSLVKTFDRIDVITSNELNPYFVPNLFEIVRKKLNTIALWTGVMIPQGIRVIDKAIYSERKLRNKTRLDNNAVENYFGFLKRKIMMSSKKMLPSELVRKIYNNVKSKYLEFYSELSKKKLENAKVKTSKNRHWTIF